MGTPDFAVCSLERLLSNGHDVVGVVTNPDRPSGRGRKVRPSPVKEKALEHDLPLLQPEGLRDPAFIRSLRSWAPDLQVVVAFRLLPKEVRSIPYIGSINLHASLLPAYRGAAPIQRAIMNGETHTGVTTFFIEEGMDKGDILLKEKVGIGKDTTAGELHDELMELGADLVQRTVKGIEEGSLEPTPQDAPGNDTITRAPKLGPEDRRFDPKLPAKELHDRIRGLSPFPGVQCELVRSGDGTLRIKLLRTKIWDETDENARVEEPGTIIEVHSDILRVSTTRGTIALLEVQPAGKKPMKITAFLRGYRVAVGDRLR